VIFALLALEGLETDASLRSVLATISIAVLISVVSHGASAGVLADRFGAWAQTHPAGLTEPGALEGAAVAPDEGVATDTTEEPKPRGWRRFVAH
jgi:hypothetical protein